MSDSLYTEIQAAIYDGLASAAEVIGVPFNVFRPASTVNPLAGTPLTTLAAAFDVNGSFSKASGFKDQAWRVYLDGSQTLPGDYLVEVSPTQTGQPPRVFYMLSQQPLLPPMAVMCHNVMSFARPGTPVKDASGYSQPGAATPIMTGWPCSFVIGTKGERSETGLPRDTRQPWYAVTLPDAGVEIRTDDVATDETGHRYIVSAAERSDLGWRLSLQYVGA